MMADPGGGSSSGSVLREYRKGNWTVQETMVLIEAKKMDDERRMKRSGGRDTSEGMKSKPAELRWKWVEDYCWRKGCLRSQNQCNDKWDNLMRDYKKVRDYERRLVDGGSGTNINIERSYWKIDKNERKDNNLPSNMLPQIYDALMEVVERKGATCQRLGFIDAAPTPSVTYVVERPIHQPSLPCLLQHHISSAPISALPPPPPTTQQTPLPYSQAFATSLDSDTSESPAKRRRKGEGTSGTATASTSSHEVGSAISKSASIIADAIQACEDRQEKRHRELLNLHETRLKIEEAKTEINRQGFNGLVDSINKLASSILALATHKNQSTPK